ncbi:MAG TPA: Cof-type HAD-IIB family hydrolase [Prevotella sp.]
MSKKYALFFDIDGTLVSFKTHSIPLSTINALEQAKKNGIKIFISTGRPVQIITNIDAISHLVDGYITTNGAYCFVGDSTIRCKSIPKEDVQRLLDDASQKDYAVIVVGKKDIAIHNYKDIVDRLFRIGFNVTNLDYTLPVTNILQQDILQLTPFITQDMEDALMPLLKSCKADRWHPEFTDITAQGIDKGSALLTMASALNIDIKDTIAFGDGGNDINILKNAGIGIAMGNANEQVKQQADYVTTEVDNDGVWNALKHFHLI